MTNELKKVKKLLSLKFLLLFLLIFAVNGHAKIVEIKKLEEIKPYINKDTLVIFDIDNTLIEPMQTLGSDQWFDREMIRAVAVKEGVAEAIVKVIDRWKQVRTLTRMQTVEKVTAAIIEKMQRDGLKVMALTTQGLDMSYFTLKQLKDLGINFIVSAPSKQEIFFLNEDKGVLFKDGVLFTEATDKGKALIKLLEAIHFSPKEVVFINDKKPPLLDVEDDCVEHNIQFLGVRYGYLDAKVASYNQAIADIELANFGKILSDDETKKILRKKSTKTFAEK